MPEELCSNELARKGGAVHGDEGPRSPALFMNKSSEPLFAGARLADQQEGEIRRCNATGSALHPVHALVAMVDEDGASSSDHATLSEHRGVGPEPVDEGSISTARVAEPVALRATVENKAEMQPGKLRILDAHAGGSDVAAEEQHVVAQPQDAADCVIIRRMNDDEKCRLG